MNVQELINFTKENKTLKEEQIKAKIAKYINTKKYISVKDKKKLVDNIVDNCILYRDGRFCFNEFDKYMTFVMYTIEAYTDIELSGDIECDYDMLCEENILNIVISTFESEYNEVNIILDMKCGEILGGNNIEAQFGRFLNTVVEKLDTFTDVLSNGIKNFDINNLPITSHDIETIKQFLNISKE